MQVKFRKNRSGNLPMKKRKYSRNGCIECKRRKMKCDETKPCCLNCSKLSKICVYEVKEKFRFENSITSKGSADSNIKGKAHDGVNDILAVKFYTPNRELGGKFMDPKFVDTKNSPSSIISAARDDVSKFRHEIIHPTTLNCDAKNSPNIVSIPYSIPISELELCSPAEVESSQPPFLKNTISKNLSIGNDLLGTPSIDFDPGQMKSLFDEASLLVSDINDLVSSNLMSQMQNVPEEKVYTQSDTSIGHTVDLQSDTNRISQKSLIEPYENHNFHVNDLADSVGRKKSPNNTDITNFSFYKSFQLPNSELANFNLVKYNLSEPHKSYLNSLVHSNLSYNLFPFAISIESNEVIRLLLQYSRNCTYLLTSLLAISATFELIRTGKKMHDIARQKYVSTCLNLLSTGFANKTKSPHDLANEIEGLLLTILVLSSNFTATSFLTTDDISNSWKIHLRGVKDLLINYSNAARAHNLKYVSGGLALAKSWFFAIEALASVYSPLGGTLFRSKISNDRDENKNQGIKPNYMSEEVYADTGYFSKSINPEYHDALVKHGLLYTNGTGLEFNLFIGFSMRIVYLIEEFTKALDLLRVTNRKQISQTKIAKLIALVQDARKTEIASGVCKSSFLIPKHSLSYPTSSNMKYHLHEAGYWKVKNLDGTIDYYSWFDISEQIRVDCIYLKILITEGLLKLPLDHSLVEELIRRIMNYLFFIRSKNSPNFHMDKGNVFEETNNYYLPADVFDTRCIMVQSPFRVCSTLVTEEDDFERLELFFKGLIKTGNGSAVYALESLNKKRDIVRSRKKGSQIISREEIFCDNDEDDIEEIAFA